MERYYALASRRKLQTIDAKRNNNISALRGSRGVNPPPADTLRMTP